MTAPPAHSQAQIFNLYDRDLALWYQNTLAQLRAGDLGALDVEHLINDWADSFRLSWLRALKQVRRYYPQVKFPDQWPFDPMPEAILSLEFWQMPE